ncbi:MAG: hypothetical protein LUD22_01650 [Coprobacillus sp.]|nr:hypothetical protein [Coprobacillus sp.]
MRDLEMRIWAFVNIGLLLIFGILPPVLLSTYNVLPGFGNALDICFWLCYAVTIILCLSYVMMCMNNRRKQERIPFLVSEILLIVLQLLPTFTWLFNLVEGVDNIYLVPVITDIVLIFAFFGSYLWLYYKNTKRRYQ